MRQNPVGEPREWQDDTDRSNDEASLACAMFWKDAFVEPPIAFALQDNSSTLGPVPRWPEFGFRHAAMRPRAWYPDALLASVRF